MESNRLCMYCVKTTFHCLNEHFQFRCITCAFPKKIKPINIIYISVWICKNTATEISLIYPLTESCSGACSLFFFLIVTFYLFNRYRIGHSRLTLLSFSQAINLLPLPPLKKNVFTTSSHNSLSMSV